MTDPEIDQRLRVIERWQAGHEEKCNGRQEKIILGLESLQVKSDQNTAAINRMGKRVVELEKSKSWLQGASAAIGGAVGVVVIKVVLGLLGINL